MRRIALAVLFACTACAGSGEPTHAPTDAAADADASDDVTQGTAGTTVVFLVRHAEKGSEGKDPPLTDAGSARATCLAGMLKDAGVTHLFATEYQRTQLTVAPLAAALGLEVVVLPPADGDALIEQLDGLPPNSVAVVAGHSNTVPAIAAALGGGMTDLDEKGYIPHETYDLLVQVFRAPDVRATQLQLHYCAPSSQ